MWQGRALYLISTAIWAVAFAAHAQALDIRPDEAPAKCGARTPQIEVTVSGVTKQGILTVELYRPSAKDFLHKESRVHRIRVAAKQGAQTVCFDIEKSGTYALAAYHDIDGNRKLARKWNRMPAEPFAMSNNRPLRLEIPKFEDAAFTVGERGAAIRLELQR